MNLKNDSTIHNRAVNGEEGKLSINVHYTMSVDHSLTFTEM